MFVILVNRWFARIDGVQMYKRFDVPTFDFETQWKLKHSTNTHLWKQDKTGQPGGQAHISFDT